jgi:hypothetical protein
MEEAWVVMVMVVLQLEEERQDSELPLAHWATAVTVIYMVLVGEVVTMEEVDHLYKLRCSVVVEEIIFDYNNIFYITRI